MYRWLSRRSPPAAPSQAYKAQAQNRPELKPSAPSLGTNPNAYIPSMPATPYISHSDQPYQAAPYPQPYQGMPYPQTQGQYFLPADQYASQNAYHYPAPPPQPMPQTPSQPQSYMPNEIMSGPAPVDTQASYNVEPPRPPAPQTSHQSDRDSSPGPTLRMATSNDASSGANTSSMDSEAVRNMIRQEVAAMIPAAAPPAANDDVTSEAPPQYSLVDEIPEPGTRGANAVH
jgi:hypothetical protein